MLYHVPCIYVDRVLFKPMSLMELVHLKYTSALCGKIVQLLDVLFCKDLPRMCLTYDIFLKVTQQAA